MNDTLSGHTFGIAVRMKQIRDAAPPASAEAELRLPRLRPSEITAAAGLEAVRRALQDLLCGSAPA